MARTKIDQSVIRRYEAAQPEKFGNLHERMKYVIELARKSGLESTDNGLWHAIWDLATEVKAAEPVDPPHGHRRIRVG